MDRRYRKTGYEDTTFFLERVFRTEERYPQYIQILRDVYRVRLNRTKRRILITQRKSRSRYYRMRERYNHMKAYFTELFKKPFGEQLRSVGKDLRNNFVNWGKKTSVYKSFQNTVERFKTKPIGQAFKEQGLAIFNSIRKPVTKYLERRKQRFEEKLQKMSRKKRIRKLARKRFYRNQRINIKNSLSRTRKLIKDVFQNFKNLPYQQAAQKNSPLIRKRLKEAMNNIKKNPVFKAVAKPVRFVGKVVMMPVVMVRNLYNNTRKMTNDEVPQNKQKIENDPLGNIRVKANGKIKDINQKVSNQLQEGKHIVKNSVGIGVVKDGILRKVAFNNDSNLIFKFHSDISNGKFRAISNQNPNSILFINDKYEITERYDKKDFNRFQWEQIKYGIDKGMLNSGFDIKIFANPKLSSAQMYAIQKAISDSQYQAIPKDVIKKIANPKFSPNQMELLLDVMSDRDIIGRINSVPNNNMNRDELATMLLSGNYSYAQMKELKYGFEQGLDVKKYANPDFSEFQMRELQKALIDRQDISEYANPKISAMDMRNKRIKDYKEIHNISDRKNQQKETAKRNNHPIQMQVRR